MSSSAAISSLLVCVFIIDSFFFTLDFSGPAGKYSAFMLGFNIGGRSLFGIFFGGLVIELILSTLVARASRCLLDLKVTLSARSSFLSL